MAHQPADKPDTTEPDNTTTERVVLDIQSGTIGQQSESQPAPHPKGK